MAAGISKKLADCAVAAKVRYSRKVDLVGVSCVGAEVDEEEAEREGYEIIDLNRPLVGDC